MATTNSVHIEHTTQGTVAASEQSLSVADSPAWSEDVYMVSLYATYGFIVAGLVTNAINLIVFLVQGLRDAVTISLFALSLSDFLISFMLFGSAVATIIRSLNPGFIADPDSLALGVFAYPRSAAYFFSTCVTGYLSIERSLCVIMPFKFKAMFTVKKTVVILVCMAAVTAGIVVPIFFTQGLEWRWDPRHNTTRLLMYIDNTEQRVKIQLMFVVFSSLLLPVGSQVTVGVATALMIYGLTAVTKFKEKSSSKGNAEDSKKEGLSGKELRAVRMVLGLSIVFFICNFPLMLAGLAQVVWPEFKLMGGLNWIFMLVYSYVYMFGGLNAAVNFFIYYSFSSKFKQVFLGILGAAAEQNSKEQSTNN